MSDAPSKSDAQRRADQIAAFRAEIAELGREGVTAIDRVALAAVAAHHDALLQRLTREFDVDVTTAGRRMSRGMQIASLLGAAALTAAVVSFVYRVWGVMPAGAQVALLTGAPMAAIAVTIVAGRLEKTGYIAALLAIVACGAFVLQTVMLGQVFNLRGSPHAIGWWAAFAFAVAIPWRFTVPFAWGVIALIAYLSALMMAAADVAWTSFPERPETIALSAAAVAAASLSWPPAFRIPARAVALVLALAPILVLSSTGGPSVLPWSSQSVRIAYQLAAVVAAVVVIGAGLRSGANDVVVVGAVFAGLFIVTRFVDWWWDWMPKYVFFLILAGVAIGWLWLLRVARRRLAAAAV
jgi:hypothetical protein